MLFSLFFFLLPAPTPSSVSCSNGNARLSFPTSCGALASLLGGFPTGESTIGIIIFSVRVNNNFHDVNGNDVVEKRGEKEEKRKLSRRLRAAAFCSSVSQVTCLPQTRFLPSLLLPLTTQCSMRLPTVPTSCVRHVFHYRCIADPAAHPATPCIFLPTYQPINLPTYLSIINLPSPRLISHFLSLSCSLARTRSFTYFTRRFSLGLFHRFPFLSSSLALPPTTTHLPSFSSVSLFRSHSFSLCLTTRSTSSHVPDHLVRAVWPSQDPPLFFHHQAPRSGTLRIPEDRRRFRYSHSRPTCRIIRNSSAKTRTASSTSTDPELSARDLASRALAIL